MLALEWLKNAHGIMEKLEATQLENIKKAATVMADSIEAVVGYTRSDVAMPLSLLRKCIRVSVVSSVSTRCANSR